MHKDVVLFEARFLLSDRKLYFAEENITTLETKRGHHLMKQKRLLYYVQLSTELIRQSTPCVKCLFCFNEHNNSDNSLHDCCLD